MYVVMWHNRRTINHSVVGQMLWEISNRRLLRCLITGDYTLSLMCARNALTHTHTYTRAQNSPRLLIKQVILLHIPLSHSTDAAERHAWRGGRAAGSLFDSNARVGLICEVRAAADMIGIHVEVPLPRVVLGPGLDLTGFLKVRLSSLVPFSYSSASCRRRQAEM